ncbi:MAG: (2Fe-2S)-binding protein [Bdellovibrionales bacterium]|nr:(2Fe-2S)-binding protein [Bdellovibrionales bacterium]
MKVRFLPQDVEFEIKPDQSVMELAHEKGIKIKSVCNGMPSCAECRVKVVEGEHNVFPPSAKELSLIGTGHFIDQRRLSCQLKCFGDVTINLEEQMDKVITDQQRRPQGSLRKDDTEVSRAVTGNLIEEESQLLEMVEKEVKTPRRDVGDKKNRNNFKRRQKTHRYRPNKNKN